MPDKKQEMTACLREAGEIFTDSFLYSTQSAGNILLRLADELESSRAIDYLQDGRLAATRTDDVQLSSRALNLLGASGHVYDTIARFKELLNNRIQETKALLTEVNSSDLEQRVGEDKRTIETLAKAGQYLKLIGLAAQDKYTIPLGVSLSTALAASSRQPARAS